MDEIQCIADNLTKQYNTNNPWQLCAKLGIVVFISDLPSSVRGFCHISSNQAMIHVSKWLSNTQMKLVCAHELGHAVLHQNEGVCLSLGRAHMEREAEHFKCCLLGLEQPMQEKFSQKDISGFTHLSQELLILDF